MVTMASLGATGDCPFMACKCACFSVLHAEDESAHPIVDARCTFGFPSVMVPVLSKTMCVILEPSSRARPPFLRRIPYLAAAPVAVITAVGVASPRAQGHATSRVVRPYCMTYRDFSRIGQWLPGAMLSIVTTPKTKTIRYQTKAVATER